MSQPTTATIDVRDMLCAQALALVAQAMERVAAGHALEIVYNAEDVKRDLLIWAHERGYGISHLNEMTLRLMRPS